MTPKERAYEQLQEMLAESEIVAEANRNRINELTEENRQIRYSQRDWRIEMKRLEAEILQENQAASARAIDWEKVGPYMQKCVERTPELLEFQQEDLAFMFDRALRTKTEDAMYGVLNANAMGLGKTIETGAFLKTMDGSKTLWLTKKSLIRSTAVELGRWGYGIFPLVGSTSDKIGALKFMQLMPMQNIITNYESLNNPKVLAMLKAMGFDYLVVDEVHRLKGGASVKPTNVWVNTKELMTACPDMFPIFLTGSPIQNRISDVWAYLHLFAPDIFDSRRKFEVMFDMHIDPQKLLAALAPNMIRRRKDEVGIQLPAKQRITHDIELPDGSDFKARYKELADKMFAQFPEGNISIVNMLQHLHYLRAIALAPGKLKYTEKIINPFDGSVEGEVTKEMTFNPIFPKLDYCFSLVCELLDEEVASAQIDNSVPGGVVIWTAQFNSPVKYLKSMFEDFGYKVGTIMGDTKDAGLVEKKFQEGEIQILICNQKSAAEGFNFQRSDRWPGGASHSVHLDLWYNPALNEQAEDRIWRTGTRMPVTIHRLNLVGSVDELILEIVEDKEYVINGVMEQNALRPASEWKDKLKRIFDGG